MNLKVLLLACWISEQVNTIYTLLASGFHKSNSFSTKIIPPGLDYELTVKFQDTVAGEFFRTISILFENKKTDIQFELSGEIINPNNKQ